MQQGSPMNEYVVVSNATPIIFFQNIGYLYLLKSLYGKIHIPKAVYDEIMVDHDFLSAIDWIKVVGIRNIDAKHLFRTGLHAGEVEAIILSTEMSADLLILDDLLARKHAKLMGISITGTLGVLITLKNKDIIQSIKPFIKQLIAVGMYIDDKLYAKALSAVNE